MHESELELTNIFSSPSYILISWQSQIKNIFYFLPIVLFLFLSLFPQKWPLSAALLLLFLNPFCLLFSSLFFHPLPSFQFSSFLLCVCLPPSVLSEKRNPIFSAMTNTQKNHFLAEGRIVQAARPAREFDSSVNSDLVSRINLCTTTYVHRTISFCHGADLMWPAGDGMGMIKWKWKP